jgi:hypothetical protein
MDDDKDILHGKPFRELPLNGEITSPGQAPQFNVLLTLWQQTTRWTVRWRHINMIRKTTFTALLFSGLACAAIPAIAADLDVCSGSSLARAQCECNTALSIGTPSALKKFLSHYSSKGTACAATASTKQSTRPASTGGSSGGGGNSGGSGGGSTNSGGGSSTGGGGGTHGSGGTGGNGGNGGVPMPPPTPSNPGDGTDAPPDGSGNVPKGG